MTNATPNTLAAHDARLAETLGRPIRNRADRRKGKALLRSPAKLAKHNARRA